MTCGLSYMSALVLGHGKPTPCTPYPPVSLLPSNDIRWYWNINQLSIGYAIRLSLGPDLPWADEPSSGNLRFSMVKILTSLSLLIPAFSLVYSPLLLSVQLLPVYDAPLPRVRYHYYPQLVFSPVWIWPKAFILFLWSLLVKLPCSLLF